MDKHPKLGILIKFIHNAIEKDCNSMLKEMGLTTTQLDVLMYILLNQNRAMKQIDIEREFKIKNPTVTGILKRLENKGLVRRVVCSNDARCKQILATDKSRSMEKKVHQKGDMIDKRLVEGFTEEEQKQMRALLERVLNNYRTNDP